jgi:hypothetical protein
MKAVLFAALLATSALVPAGASLAQMPPAPAPAATDKKGPANLCQELIAFVRQPDPAAAQAQSGAPAASAAQQTAVAAPQQTGQGAAPAQPSGQGAPSAPGVSGPTPQAPPPGQGATTTQPSGQGAPTTSGLSGPTPSATSQGTPGPQAAGQSPAVTQAQPAPAAPPAQAAAPAAPATPPAPKPSPAAIEKAETAARDNNLAGCRGAAQEMRRAGVALPAPLIALAGLDLKFFEVSPPR